MIDERSKVLTTSMSKLYSRGARHNIQKILVKSHEADIAAALEEMKPTVAADIFRMEPDIERRAQVLAYFKEDFQRDILELLSGEEKRRLIPLMDSDDAADLIGRLPEDQSKELLEALSKEDSEDVTDLLGYDEESAGGLMSSDYFAVNRTLTIEETIQAIQEDAGESVAFYVYVINDNEQLIGVVSLKQLLLSKPGDVLQDMISNVISVDVSEEQEKVARIVERYDFLSIPVVDGGNQLVGVITVDDVIDVIREEAEEDLLAMGQAGWGMEMTYFESAIARIPWLMFSFLGGVTCFYIIYRFFLDRQDLLDPVWTLVAFAPALLSVGSMAGSQAATFAIGAIRGAKVDGMRILKHFARELSLAIPFAFILAGMVFLLLWWLLPELAAIRFLAITLALNTVIVMLIGSGLPFLFRRLNLDPTVVSLPALLVIADIVAILILFGR